MKRLALVGLTVGFAALVAQPKIVEACGGCFGPQRPTETQQVVTDHRMVLAVHPAETILWDQIRYTGAPDDFSWVLPVSGDVRIELGSSEFFDILDQGTAVRVIGPQPAFCPPSSSFGFGANAAAASDAGAADSSVQVIHQETVGPYDTVTLRSTDASALTDWLRTNSYVIPASIEPVITWYVDRHMDFIALRLHPGQGVQAMQPVRIRYASANMVLPLRMVAAGVADKVGISLWVFGHGRQEAQNFSNAVINVNDLIWNWDTNTSNFAQVFRDTQAHTANGRSWITEYANPGSFLSFQFENNNFGGFPDAGVDPDGGVNVPSAHDDWTLASDNDDPQMWVTRMRTDLAANFLDADLVLQASLNNAQVNNQLYVTRTSGTEPVPSCPGRTVVGGAAGSGVSCRATPGHHGHDRDLGFAVGALALAGVIIRARRRGPSPR